MTTHHYGALAELRRTAAAQHELLLECQIPEGYFDAAIQSGIITGERDFQFPWVFYTPHSDFCELEVNYLPWLACQPTTPPDRRTPTPPLVAGLYALSVREIGVLASFHNILMLEEDRSKASSVGNFTFSFTDTINDDQWDWIDGIPVETPQYAIRSASADIADLSWLARILEDARYCGVSMDDLCWAVEPAVEYFPTFADSVSLVNFCFEEDVYR